MDDIKQSPPHSLETEKTILCAILIDNFSIQRILEYLVLDSFYDNRHKLIFQAMMQMIHEGRPCDLITLTEYLKKNGKLHQCGGTEYISTLLNATYEASHISDYCKIIVEKERLRQLRTLGTDILRESTATDANLLEIAERAYCSLNDITHDRYRAMYKPLPLLINETCDIIKNIRENPRRSRGISTGFQELDAMTLGFHPGTLTVIAAAPSFGKTSLAVNLLYNAGIIQNLPVAFYSLDRTAEYISARLISSSANIETHLFLNGQLSDEDLHHISHTAHELQSASIFLNDNPDIGMLNIRFNAYRLQAEHDVRLILVDGLNFMRMNQGHSNAQENLINMLRELKRLASDLVIPVVVTYRLDSRQLGNCNSRRPTMGTLSEANALERHADLP